MAFTFAKIKVSFFESGRQHVLQNSQSFNVTFQKVIY